jgi:two-component sensor histidine kinase
MIQRLNRLVRYPLLRERAVLGCLFGALAGMTAVVGQLALDSSAGVWIGLFPFSYSATMLSTVVGDVAAGAASLSVSSLGIWYFLIERHYSFSITNVPDQLGFLLYLGTGVFIIVVTHLLIGAVTESAAAARRETLLLRELQHRVKNHIQLVGSLLGVQARMSGNELARNELLEARERMNVVAKAYSNAYAFGLKIAVPQHVNTLCTALAKLRGSNTKIEMSIVNVEWELDRIVPFSLILNELVMNAMKHGGSGDLRIRVTLNRSDSDSYCLAVEDSGPGLPAGFDLDRQRTFGLSIVKLLVGNLNGVVSAENNDGAVFRVRIPA